MVSTLMTITSSLPLRTSHQHRVKSTWVSVRSKHFVPGGLDLLLTIMSSAHGCVILVGAQQTDVLLFDREMICRAWILLLPIQQSHSSIAALYGCGAHCAAAPR